MLQYHTRLLLPQLIPHSRLQGGWSFIQIKCLSLFGGVFLFQIQKDVLPFNSSGLGSGDSWKAVGCRESGGWTKEHLQLHEHHYKVLQAMLMKQTMMFWMLWNTKEAMLIRIDRESAGLRERARREGWWGGEEVTFFPSCLHLVLSCLHLGDLGRWGGNFFFILPGLMESKMQALDWAKVIGASTGDLESPASRWWKNLASNIKFRHSFATIDFLLKTFAT